MPEFSGYTVLSRGIDYALVLRRLSVTPAGAITDLSVPLGWLSQRDRFHSVPIRGAVCVQCGNTERGSTS